MAMRSGMYSSNKRKKELSRKKKQEEKRLKRQKNSKNPSQALEETDPANAELVVNTPDTPEVMHEKMP